MRRRVLRGYNPCGQRLCTTLRRGKRRCIDWVRRKELFCANVYILMNIHHHTNLNNFETACRLPHWPWHLFPGCHFSPHIRLLAEAVAGLASLNCDELCAKEDLDLAVCCFLTGVGGGSEAGRAAPDPYAELQQHDCDYAIRPSWTPLRRGVNNWRNSPANLEGW